MPNQWDTARYLSLFVGEATEHLDALGKELVRLEGGVTAEAIDSLFRHAHSVKGMAGSMGFEGTAELGHRLEDLLDRVRTAPHRFDRLVADLVLQAVDALAEHVKAASAGTAFPDATALTQQLKTAAEAMRPGTTPLPFTIVVQDFGGIASLLFALTAMITVASCANANIMGGPRIIFSMARDGLLPDFFQSVNRGGSPSGAMLLTALFSAGVTLSGTFNLVFGLIGTMNALGGIVIIVGLFVLRRREPDLPRPYRAFLYPALPVVALVLEATTLVLYSAADTTGILFAIGLCLACVPFALVARRGRIRLGDIAPR